MGVGWILGFVALWATTSLAVLPTPREVLGALGSLLCDRALLAHLLSSLGSGLTAVTWSTAISLGLAYLSVVPAVRPLADFVGKFRFWGFAGATVLFTLLLQGGHALKVALVTFGITGFFVRSMCDEVQAIPRERFEYARTLGMGPWRIAWEVVVLGTLDRAFDVLRQNAAMAWMLLTMVETLVRSEGGIGVVLANQTKHMDLAGVAAMQAIVFAIGIVQDALIGAFKSLVCPYAALKTKRSRS